MPYQLCWSMAGHSRQWEVKMLNLELIFDVLHSRVTLSCIKSNGIYDRYPTFVKKPNPVSQNLSWVPRKIFLLLSRNFPTVSHSVVSADSDELDRQLILLLKTSGISAPQRKQIFFRALFGPAMTKYPHILAQYCDENITTGKVQMFNLYYVSLTIRKRQNSTTLGELCIVRYSWLCQTMLWCILVCTNSACSCSTQNSCVIVLPKHFSDGPNLGLNKYSIGKSLKLNIIELPTL